MPHTARPTPHSILHPNIFQFVIWIWSQPRTHSIHAFCDLLRDSTSVQVHVPVIAPPFWPRGSPVYSHIQSSVLFSSDPLGAEPSKSSIPNYATPPSIRLRVPPVLFIGSLSNPLHSGGVRVTPSPIPPFTHKLQAIRSPSETGDAEFIRLYYSCSLFLTLGSHRWRLMTYIQLYTLMRGAAVPVPLACLGFWVFYRSPRSPSHP